MLVLDEDSLAQTEGGKVPGVFTPLFQTSGEPGFHGELSLLPAVDPDLGGRKVPRLDGEEILDWPAKDKLGWREFVF